MLPVAGLQYIKLAVEALHTTIALHDTENYLG